HKRWWWPAAAAAAVLAGAPAAGAYPAPSAGPLFTQVPSPTIAGKTAINGVAALSRSEAWAVGEATSPTNYDHGQFGLALHWNGTAWTQFPTPDTKRFDEVLT